MRKSGFQAFVENLTQSILSIVKIILLSKPGINFSSVTQRECVILGNGPSLKDFLSKHLKFLEGKGIIAVNNFVRTETYLKVRPEYYVITSPEHFQGDSNQEWHQDRMKTFKIMSEKTNWKITLFVPVLAKKYSEWQVILQGNNNINIKYFNNTPIEGFKRFKKFCFNKNLGMPRPHNVLIPSLMLSINMGFKTIYVAGADHSWVKEIFVTDQNEVLLNQRHFYDKEVAHEKTNKNKPVPKPMYIGGTGKTRKLHEVLMKFYYSFRSYWDIKDYATSLNVNIVNITPGSFIDAFQKKQL